MIIQEHYKEYLGIYPVENKERIERIIKEFPEYEIENLKREKAEKELLKVHSKNHYDKFLSLCKSRVNTGDLNFHKGLIDVALNAINASIKAAEKQEFAAIRPAGHHAYKEKFAGFCYFNNIVISIQRFIEKDEKVAIIDFDAHYGNGTHHLVKDKENVFYYSIHADTKRYYPGVEYNSKNSFLINVDPETEDDEKYIKHFKRLSKKVEEFKPDVIAISAGFDTWWKDNVLGFNIKKEETYREIGKIIKSTGVEGFALLEGGYHEDLGRLVKEFIGGWVE